MEVLVTGAGTELGQVIARGFHDAGHRLTLLGEPGEIGLAAAAAELGATAIGCDNTDPAGLTQARGLVPHHLDVVVNVPAPRRTADDSADSAGPDGLTGLAGLAGLAGTWRNILDTTVLSTVLTVGAVGDHLRSGGSIISVVPGNPADGSAGAAAKTALSNWTAAQATVFGTRGITVNVVAGGNGSAPATPGNPDYPDYPGSAGPADATSVTAAGIAAEITRLALFLTTPAARHITGQTMHVGHRALARFG